MPTPAPAPSRLGFFLFLALLLAGLGLFGTWFWLVGLPQGWELWHFPVMTPHFADLRTITGGAESFAQGLDPMVENPHDPWNRVMSYPRVWQLLFLFGIDQSHTTLLGLAVLALFLAGVLLLARRIEPAAALVLLLALFSPAVVLGVERGNNDLVVFFFVALGLFLLPRRGGGALAALLAAFALKLYPIFALAALLRFPPGRMVRLGLIGAAVGAAYLAATWSDLALLEKGVLKGTYLSYGLGVFGTQIATDLNTPHLEQTIGTLATALVAVLVGIVWLLARGRTGAGVEPEESEALDGFRAGAAIYLGTFLLGHNWDYRLALLLFTIPQLVAWSLRGAGLRAWSARFALAALLLSLWSLRFHAWMAVDPPSQALYFRLDEGANWLLLATLLFLFVDSLPGWMRRPLGLPVQGDTTPGTQMAPVLQRGLALGAVVLLAAFHLGHNRPLYNWDLLGYAGVAHSWSGASPEEVHRLAYEDARRHLPPEAYAPLVEQGDYRRLCAADAESFRQQLPFYSVKPAYPALIRLLQGVGMDSATAGVRIAQGSYLLLALLLAFWLLRHLEPLAAAPIAALLISTPFVAGLGLLSTPDGLSALILTSGLMLLAERISPRAGWALLAAAVAVRPDNLLLLAALAGWHIWKGKGARRDAALALGAGIGLYGIAAWLSGNYGWQVLFHHALLQPLPRPAEFTPLLGLWNYLDIYLMLAEQLTTASSFLLFLALTLIAFLAWNRRSDATPWPGLLAGSGLYMAAHWFLFPMEKDRMLVAAYLLALVALMLSNLRPRAEPGEPG